MRKMVRYTQDNSINLASGAVKAWSLKYPARWARELVWYVLGDERRILCLLETHVTHLGKKSRHGNGRVLRWCVEPFEHDWSVRRGALLTRRVPATNNDTTGLVRAGVRAPYHHHSRQALCVEPDFEDLTP
jgi:CRISPR type IV-associated protein Csf3